MGIQLILAFYKVRVILLSQALDALSKSRNKMAGRWELELQNATGHWTGECQFTGTAGPSHPVDQTRTQWHPLISNFLVSFALYSNQTWYYPLLSIPQVQERARPYIYLSAAAVGFTWAFPVGPPKSIFPESWAQPVYPKQYGSSECQFWVFCWKKQSFKAKDKWIQSLMKLHQEEAGPSVRIQMGQ